MNNTYDNECVKCVYNAGEKYGKLYCDKRGKLKIKNLKVEKTCVN